MFLIQFCNNCHNSSIKSRLSIKLKIYVTMIDLAVFLADLHNLLRNNYKFSIDHYKSIPAFVHESQMTVRFNSIHGYISAASCCDDFCFLFSPFLHQVMGAGGPIRDLRLYERTEGGDGRRPRSRTVFGGAWPEAYLATVPGNVFGYETGNAIGQRSRNVFGCAWPET